MKTTLFFLADDAPDVATVVLILGVLVCVLIFAFIGRLIGKSKGQSEGGAAMGALLGPVGLLGAAFLPDARRKCSACKGSVPDDARKCMHCGEDLNTFSVTPPPEIAVESPIISDTNRTAEPEPETSALTPCPLCGKNLKVADFKLGENFCHHCFDRFVVEK